MNHTCTKGGTGKSTVARIAPALFVLLFSAFPANSQVGTVEPDPGVSSFPQPGGHSPGTATPEPLTLRGPIDENEYIVGPGDRFSITLWGQSVIHHREAVTPEGELVLPGIAVIDVAGMRLDEAKREIIARLGRIYHHMEMSASLVELRRIQVNVLGNVSAPGTYVGTALDLSSEMLKKAGGLGEGASERNIRITRRGGTEERVDLVRYRNTGEMTANPPILDGDLIFVPFATEYLYLYGTVSRPGRYEFVPGETIGSLIRLGGGLARGAVEDTVEVREFIDSVTTRSILVDISLPDGNSHKLKDGDQVYIRAIPEWHLVERITVDGEVVFPGTYGINEGTDRLLDALLRAGGPTDDASLVDAKLIRAAGIDEVDLEFERLKTMTVEEMTETEYAYFKSKSRERLGVVVVDFEKAVAGDKEENVILKDGDQVLIPKKRETVAVSGQVANPGKIVFVSGREYGFYIERAGGYASDARKGKTRVIKGATGEWVPAKEAGVLVPGDVVWVPEKPERDWWEFTQDVVRFAASVATVYLVIDQATGN